MQRTRGTSLSESQSQQPDSTEPVDADSAGSRVPAPEPVTGPGPEAPESGRDATEETDGSPVEPPPAVRRRMPLLFAVVAVLALAADQVTKAVALHQLDPGSPVNLVGSLLRLHLMRNPGAAFSIGTGFTLGLTLVATGVVVVVLRLSRRLRSIGWTIALGLLLGGALGNLTDRFFRDPAPLRGHVIDFLELPHWPIFNVADTAVVSAAVLMVLQTLRGVSLDGTRERPKP